MATTECRGRGVQEFLLRGAASAQGFFSRHKYFKIKTQLRSFSPLAASAAETQQPLLPGTLRCPGSKGCGTLRCPAVLPAVLNRCVPCSPPLLCSQPPSSSAAPRTRRTAPPAPARRTAAAPTRTYFRTRGSGRPCAPGSTCGKATPSSTTVLWPRACAAIPSAGAVFSLPAAERRALADGGRRALAGL